MIFVVIFRNWSLVVSPCCNLILLCIMVAISLFLGLLPNVVTCSDRQRCSTSSTQSLTAHTAHDRTTSHMSAGW